MKDTLSCRPRCHRGPRPSALPRLAAALALLVLLAVLPARAHFTVDSVDRYFLVDHRDGRIVALARVPLPFLLSDEIGAGAPEGAASPVLAWDGRNIILRPDLIAANKAYFEAAIAAAHEWRIGGQVVAPELKRWRIGLLSQESDLPFAARASLILSLPTHDGPVPLGQALVDFELDLGPVRSAPVTIHYAQPPLQVPAGFSISNNLVDLIASPPFERRIAGQMRQAEIIVLPARDQAVAGLGAGMRQALTGLAGALVALGLLAGLLRAGPARPAPGWTAAGWTAAGWTAAGLVVAGSGAGLLAAMALAPELGVLLSPVRPVLPALAVLLVAIWATLVLFGRARGAATLIAAMLLGAAAGTEGLAVLGDLAARPVLRWALPAGALAIVVAAAILGAALGRLVAPFAKGARERLRRTATATILVVLAALAAVQTTRAVANRAAEGLDPLLRLSADAAVSEGFAFVAAALAELHRAALSGPDATARLLDGNAAEVLGPAAAQLAQTGLPPTAPALHEVELTSYRMRRSGTALEISALWRVLGLRPGSGHEHAKGNVFAADFVLRRGWGRWRFESLILDPTAPGTP